MTTIGGSAKVVGRDLSWCLLGVLFLFAYGCASRTGYPVLPRDSSDDAIRFVALSTTSEAVEDVEVYAISADGEERFLGRTDGFGLLRITRLEIGPNPRLLLFCRVGYFCGALRADEEGFLDYEEHLIALAPFMVR